MPAYISPIEVRPMPNLETLKKQANCICIGIVTGITRSRREWIAPIRTAPMQVVLP